MNREYVKIPIEPTLSIIRSISDRQAGKLFFAILDACCDRVPKHEVPWSLKREFDQIMDEIKELKNHPNRGKYSGNWKGGLVSVNQRNRSSGEYIKWRKDVFTRDGFQCAICGQIGGRLNAHHIQPYATCIESRYDVTNGITLCEGCHRKVHNGGIQF